MTLRSLFHTGRLSELILVGAFPFHVCVQDDWSPTRRHDGSDFTDHDERLQPLSKANDPAFFGNLKRTWFWHSEANLMHMRMPCLQESISE